MSEPSLFAAFAAARGEAANDDVLPWGFVAGSLPGTIAPTSGVHAGVPMWPDSALARCLRKEQRKP